MKLEPCPDCGADAAKPRVGSLGEPKGAWCTQCGAKANSVDAWNEGFGRRRAKPQPVVDAECDIHTLTGDALDRYVLKAYGLVRAWTQSGHIETDDEFRARALYTRARPSRFSVRLVPDPYDRDYIRAATAPMLDRAGASIGHPRHPGEIDEQYRERLLA